MSNSQLDMAANWHHKSKLVIPRRCREAACKEATTALSELESARALKESHAKISIDRFKQVESLREELEMAQARIEMARRRELKLKASAQTGKHI